jgi:hypothetical protein
VGIGHARVDGKVFIFFWFFPNHIADVVKTVMCGAHECFSTKFPRHIDGVEDGFIQFKLDGLSPGFVVGNVIDCKKLIVAV